MFYRIGNHDLMVQPGWLDAWLRQGSVGLSYVTLVDCVVAC